MIYQNVSEDRSNPPEFFFKKTNLWENTHVKNDFNDVAVQL